MKAILQTSFLCNCLCAKKVFEHKNQNAAVADQLCHLNSVTSDTMRQLFMGVIVQLLIFASTPLWLLPAISCIIHSYSRPKFFLFGQMWVERKVNSIVRINALSESSSD